jgi:alpha-glucosidase
MRVLIAALFVSSFLTLSLAQTAPVVVKSPGGALEVSVATLSGNSPADIGQLAYRVSLQGKAVLDWSRLGLDIQGLAPLGSEVRIVSSRPSTIDDTWTSPQGKANPIRNRYNALTVETVEPARRMRTLNLEVRAFDDGVAFRYQVPEQPSFRELRIAAELTQFRFSKDGRTFPLILQNYRTSYEDEYHELPLSGLQPAYLIGLPLLVELPGVAWIGLTEAHIDNYAGMYVGRTQDARTLQARLSPRIDEPGLAVSTATPMSSPWRVLMISPEPGRLVE